MKSRLLRYIIIFLITIATFLHQINELKRCCSLNLAAPLSWLEWLSIGLPTLIALASLILAEISLAATHEAVSDRLEEIEDILPIAIRHLFKSGELRTNENLDTIRANIMKPHLVIRGFRIKKVLKIISSYNFDPWESLGERDLLWESVRGACGWAWHRAQEFEQEYRWSPVIFDRSKIKEADLKAHWNLSDKQIKATAHIQWIISIPIVYYPGGNDTNPIFLGILNIDGIEPLKNNKILLMQKFNRVCKSWGSNFGKFFAEKDLVAWMKRPGFLL